MMKPDDGYICCIVNPKAGSTSRNILSRKFEDYLKKIGFDVRIKITTSLENACELATDAAVDFKCGMVIVVGGDGTIREVAHGLEGSDKPLFIVASGTENLLANELGFDDDLDSLIRMFKAGYSRPLDLGCANGRCFTSIAGFGFDGDVVKMVTHRRDGHIDHFDYFWPIWKSFWDYKFPPMKVQVDGKEIFDGRCLVFVGNISRYAVGLQILHDADYSDGLLDICIYKCASHLRLVKHSAMTILKKHSTRADVIYLQGKNIKISSDTEGIQTELDGDPGPPLPVEIEIIPHAVNIIVPQDAKPTGLRTRLLRALR